MYVYMYFLPAEMVRVAVSRLLETSSTEVAGIFVKKIVKKLYKVKLITEWMYK